MLNNNNRTLVIFSESSYPGGGGEETLFDIAILFSKKNIKVLWYSLHD